MKIDTCLSWSQWLAFRARRTCKRILIDDVPEDFSILDVFPPATGILERGGRLALVFNPEADLARVILRIAGRVSAFGYRLDTQASSFLGLGILVFSSQNRTSDGDVLFRSCRGYEDSTRSLFRKVFGAPISSGYWQWKYPMDQENYGMVGISDHQVVAHYGVSTRMVCVEGRRLKAAQIGDVMVDREFRGGVVSGVFAQLFRYTSAQLGGSDRGEGMDAVPIVAYGFPHGRHMRLAMRIRAYLHAGALYSVRVKPSLSDIGFSRVTNAEDGLVAYWNLCWEKMKGSLQDFCVLDRDWSYFLRRYFYHPEKKYALYRAHGAVLVVSDDGGKSRQLLDYIGDVSEFSQVVSGFASYIGGVEIRAWILDWQYQMLCDKEHFAVDDTSAAFAISYRPDGDFVGISKKSWWISMGDADFL